MTVCLRDVEVLTRALQSVSDFADSEVWPLLRCRICDLIDKIVCFYTELCQALQAAVDRFVCARQPHAATTNILANALHAVFTIPADDDGTRVVLQAACFEYLRSGGMRASGPVGLLAGCVPASPAAHAIRALFSMRVRAGCHQGPSL